MKKGISTVIATLLMLVITIALAGFAYTYISSVLQARTAVTLDILESTCIGNPISVTVRNEGTSPSGTVTVSGTQPDGSTSAGAPCTIATINAGVSGSCSITRTVGAATGTYRIRVTAGGANPVLGIVYCAGAG